MAAIPFPPRRRDAAQDARTDQDGERAARDYASRRGWPAPAPFAACGTTVHQTTDAQCRVAVLVRPWDGASAPDALEAASLCEAWALSGGEPSACRVDDVCVDPRGVIRLMKGEVVGKVGASAQDELEADLRDAAAAASGMRLSQARYQRPDTMR